MRVLIVGGTGFLGQELRARAERAGHAVTVTSRQPARSNSANPSRLVWDTTSQLQTDAPFDAVVNLAGANLFGRRWSAAYKRKVRSSRIDTTRRLVEWMADSATKPSVLVNASAVGYYGLPRDTVDESAGPGNDFLAAVCRDWEQAAGVAAQHGVRVVCMRFGIILGRRGGALGRLEPIFRMGAGGTIGNGKHPFPWVSRRDAACAVLAALGDADMAGAYNVVAPREDTNRDFTKALGRALGRPTILPVPAFVLKMMYGDGAGELTSGRFVTPKRLLDAQYKWCDPDLDAALGALYGGDDGADEVA